jgi:uncharacterized membrane protein YhaH (DUF805 family)
MSSPNGHEQEQPHGQNSYQSGQQPPPQTQAGQDTYAPEEDIPRQQAPREDHYAAPGQGQQASGQGQQVPGQGQEVPRQDAGWAGGQQGTYAGQQGTYNAYPPPAGGYYPGGARPLSYLDGAPVGFADAVRGAVGNMFTLRGRASRSAFWWFVLLEVIAYLIVSWISNVSTVAGIIVDILVALPLIIAGISLSVRRLHDSGRSGWWWWIGFVPVVGGIVLLVFYLLPGTPGPNRYNVTR